MDIEAQSSMSFVVYVWKSSRVSQPFLIAQILTLLKFDKNDFGTSLNSKVTPVRSLILGKELSGKTRKETWGYKTALGMLGYLQENSRPEIYMAVHQIARLSNQPIL